jgi:hypothetical protein
VKNFLHHVDKVQISLSSVLSVRGKRLTEKGTLGSQGNPSFIIITRIHSFSDIDIIDLDDCTFHTCAILEDTSIASNEDAARNNNQRGNSFDFQFKPPEGEFTLMNYRISNNPRVIEETNRLRNTQPGVSKLPFKLLTSIEEISTRVEITVTVSHNYAELLCFFC